MENDHSPLLLFFIVATLTIINSELISAAPSSLPPITSPPSPTPTPSPPSSPSPLQALSSPPPPPQQLNNIIDALIGAGDFSSWVSIISMANPMVLPLSATLLIPEDTALDRHPSMDPFLFPYHIVPQRLTFSELLLFKVSTRLPTLLPRKSISITNNSRTNFTLDNIAITHPDLYTTTTVAVHGVGAILDYSVFGNGIPPFPSPPMDFRILPPPPPPLAGGILTPPFMPIGETIGWISDAACSCTEVPIVFLIFCWVLAFKMQRNPLVR